MRNTAQQVIPGENLIPGVYEGKLWYAENRKLSSVDLEINVTPDLRLMLKYRYKGQNIDASLRVVRNENYEGPYHYERQLTSKGQVKNFEIISQGLVICGVGTWAEGGYSEECFFRVERSSDEEN